jgi:lipoprotein NlpI
LTHFSSTCIQTNWLSAGYILLKPISLAGLLIGICLSVATASSFSQTGTVKKKALPIAASKAVPPQKPTGGKGWRIGQTPSWVVDPYLKSDVTVSTAPALSGSVVRRELLIDAQFNYALEKPLSFARIRSIGTDASVLGTISQPRITFNPVFQTVVVHVARVIRDGKSEDRLLDARIDLLRREQRLDQSVIDGAETLLIVLNDVRVGDVVEVAYTVEGQNPIYDGHISLGMGMASDVPAELVHFRLTAPAAKSLNVKSLGGDIPFERFSEGNNQVVTARRSQVPAILDEEGTPPWYKVYPALYVSDFASWSEVDAWAQKLFAPANVNSTAIQQLAETFRAKGLGRDALISDVLRFVQDDIRYFSVSLGESSHRPKAPDKTLAERLGDCKDKVMLLNALLSELGFSVKPTLVSTTRNRGMLNYLPSQTEFDHVITQLDFEGKKYYLDATINGQGTQLATRGYFGYGVGLVIGAGSELQTISEPEQALNQVEYEQFWDFSNVGAPVQLKTTLRATGYVAERYRNAIASGATAKISEWLAGEHTRLNPGLKILGAPVVIDNRELNKLELSLTFEHAGPAQYSSGGLEMDFTALELYESLTGPREARRRTPFMVNMPKQVDSILVVKAARPFQFKAPATWTLSDKHFRFSTRSLVDGATLTTRRTVERLSDEVLPANLEAFRANLIKARQQSGNHLRMGLVDTRALTGEYEKIDKRMAGVRGFRDDSLHRLMLRNEVNRLFDTEVLKLVEVKSPLTARVLSSRAMANNQLGVFQAGLEDADGALGAEPQSLDALEARAVALVGLNRLDDALAAFGLLKDTERRQTALQWMGSIELLNGRPSQAERHLSAAMSEGGEDPGFAAIWLYLATEQQGGRGREAISSVLDRADPKELPGALLHFLAGKLDQDALFKLAREKPEMERLNLAEVNFYLGQQALAKGQAQEAKKWFRRSVDTGAIPYREVTFAGLHLANLK